MAAHKYGSAVVMEAGKLVGIFTTVDALRALVEILHSPSRPLTPGGPAAVPFRAQRTQLRPPPSHLGTPAGTAEQCRPDAAAPASRRPAPSRIMSWS